MATPAALLKFSLPELLPNLNRVLYLDGDVLVRRDLGELFCKFLGHCYAAVVTDAWVLTSKVPKVQKFKKWLFNSGMMLLNLALLRSRRMSETLLEEKRKSTDFSLMDQTIFNMCFAGNVCFLDFRDNFLPVWYYQNSRKIGSVEFFERFHEICGTKIHSIQEILNDDVRIVHFAGTQKPWENNEIPFACEWMACKDEFLEIKKEALIQGRLKVAPFVSVVIPVYNVEKYLRQCLDSVVNQTLKEIEIICVDDGSTDSSSRILEEYAAKDSRIKVIEQVNAGAAKARDAGIQFSRGKYIGFVDADDYIDSDFYEKLFGAAVKNGLAIAKADLKRVLNGVVEETTWSANSFIEKKQGELPLFARFHYQFTSAIYDSDLLKKNKICFADEKFLVGEDVLFLLKVCQKEESVVLVPDVFYYYVKNESSVTHIFSKAYFDDNLNYVGRGIDLLNARGIYDVGYYSWIHGRFVQMLKVVLPQINENPELSNYKPEFLARIHALAAKVNEKEKLYKNFLNEIPLYELLVEVDYPLVSVVVPVYNVEKYLRECLDSICGQTLKNIEIICVNDGSTDGSPAILEEYASKDSRMRIISQENRGLSAARNAGLSVARGKYIYFMDSDDVSPQDALGKMFAEMEKNSLDVLLFGAESFFESEDLEKAHPVYKTLYKRRPFEAQSGQSLVLAFKNAGCGFSPSACCYCSTRRFLNENSIRFPEGILYEDNVFFWKMILAAKRAKSISDALFRRRVRAGSTMTNKKISFRNFKSYATVVFELEKLKEKFLGAAIVEVLRGYARGTSETLVRFYREISMEDRARSRELLSGELKDSAWLDGVRERVAKIDAEKKEICVDTRESAVKPSGRRAGNVASPMVLPRFVVRLGALFILNKAARKRWRARHMDLTPKDGIDVNVRPELRRDSALKRFAVRAASLFIFSKKKRKAFRARHLNLTPRDGVDVRALSSQELARLREAKRSRSVLWRIFDALIPATRGKIAHAERHLRRAAEEQTRILLDELRRMSDANRRAFDENRRALNAVRADLKTVRERAEALSRELASSKTELKNQTLATERVLRAAISETREMLILKTLAVKHATLSAEENLEARLEDVREALSTVRSESAQTAAETVRSVNARADALSRAFEEALAREATSVKNELLSSEENLEARLEDVREALSTVRSESAQTAAETVRSVNARADALSRAFEEALAREATSVKNELRASAASAEKHLRDAFVQTGEALTREQEKSATQTNLALAALAKSVPESEKRVLAVLEGTDVLYDCPYEIRTREERGLCDIVSAPDFEARFRKLIAGLPEESVETVGVIIRRLQMIKGAKTKLDLWTPEEKKRLRLVRNFEKTILTISDSLFVWKNYFLPIKHFEASVFLYNHGISQLDSAEQIRGKDILDVGGFIGDSALMLHGLTEGKVYSFEASSENYKHLLKTIELNGLTNVVPVHTAVGAEKGEIELRIMGSGSSQNPGMVKNPKYVEKCPVVAMDDFVAEHRIRVGLIKVDIEGAEQAFLRGAKKTICEQKPVLLISIYHNISDFLDIKPMIERWDLGYKFKVFKPTIESVSGETVLICEQPLRD
ncbi:FkbM family methyltransferase [Candidatus Spyradosoma sp. SGI.093]|uniref:FkbM family methyltransferase n=1 Tax=Candidatus Spyradosoma sp. SGI.093 TaxID=3420583 RepID=UPI003D015B07